MRGKFDGFGTMYVEEGHFQGEGIYNLLIDLHVCLLFCLCLLFTYVSLNIG